MRRLIVVIGLLLAIFLGYLSYLAFEAKQIRHAPVKSRFLRAIRGSGPGSLFMRYILLRPGHRLYHAAILPWLYSKEAGLADTPWNRFLLENHLRQLPRELAFRYLAGYPLSGRPGLLSFLVEALEESRFSSLRFLDDFPEGRSFYQGWLNDRLLVPADAALFDKVLPTLLKLSSVDLPRLLERVFPQTVVQRRGILFDRDRLYQALKDAKNPGQLFNWASAFLSIGRGKYADVEEILAALLVTPRTSSSVASLVLKEPRVISDEELVTLVLPARCLEDIDNPCGMLGNVPDAILPIAFRSLESQPNRFLTLFHSLVHAGDKRATEVAQHVLDGPDSLTRKGVIVLLARHDLAIPGLQIDEAFRGEVPRPVLFRNKSQYSKSRAFQAYERLSGHAYHQIGKRFPPFFGGHLPMLADSSRWSEFIREYPWFPATDDAYYRLAHLYFIHGELILAAATIARFNARSFTDQDVEPYMTLLKRVVDAAVDRPRAQVARELADAGRKLALQGWLTGGAQREAALKIEDVLLAIDWVLADRPVRERLHIERDRLEKIRLDIDSARVGCTRTWFQKCMVPPSVSTFRETIERAGRTDASLERDFGFALLRVLVLSN